MILIEFYELVFRCHPRPNFLSANTHFDKFILSKYSTGGGSVQFFYFPPFSP